MDKLAFNIGDKFFGPGSHFLKEITGVGELASLLLSNALIIAGIIMLFLLVFGGFSMIAGAGQDNPERAAKGRQVATTAVIGFIIILAAYWIIQIIELLTGTDILK